MFPVCLLFSCILVMFNMPRAAINFNDHLGGGDVVDSNIIFNTCRESGDHGSVLDYSSLARIIFCVQGRSTVGIGCLF